MATYTCTCILMYKAILVYFLINDKQEACFPQPQRNDKLIVDRDITEGKM